MAQNTKQAPVLEFRNSGEDFLHLKNVQGSIIGGIDNAGAGFGAMQGGFVPPPTKILYVDVNRTDSYVADGSLLKPFKTVMAAVNQVITNGDNASFTYVIDVASGAYSEQIILENLALVYLVFYGHGAASFTGGIRSTANNSNLAQLDFRTLNITGGAGITVTFSGSGSFLSNGGNFYDCSILLSTNGWSQTGNTCQFFNSTFLCPNTSLSGASMNFLGGGINSGGSFSLTGGSTLTMQRGCRNAGSSVTIDATSTLNLGNGGRQDGAVTVNGTFANRFGTCSGAITVNSGGTYQELGGFHTGTLTINGGGNYTQTGVLGAGGVVLGAAAPTVPAGEVGLGNGTATSATAGAQTLPANPAGFLIVNIGGTVQKIPYYNN